MTTEPPAPDTLGLRLDRYARALISARAPQFSWLQPLRDLLEHVAALPEPLASRFERIETTGAVPLPIPPEHAPARSIAGTALDSETQARLRPVTGTDVAKIRVHNDTHADLLAHAHRSDAVTYGRDVYFRKGRYEPHRPEGFALLAHEATHVAEMLTPGVAWQRATGSGRDDDGERHARGIESTATDSVRRSAVTALSATQAFVDRGTRALAPIDPAASALPSFAAPAIAAPAPATVPETPAGPAPPRTAAIDRDLTAPATIDLESLRRNIIADLKRQLRSEFERGG
ncbi:DUF4157 domain-containing protein [Nocardia sp. XZ_19_385]|uniref:eCIS core domain-containing protein n=1 Tax=Nocardia sp. XZ_19_385 TaxID=2769488 RepID=UPI00188E2BED|nr:DUF4157 domain-containing protein [Nocardia sp. XZ_19_385]